MKSFNDTLIEGAMADKAKKSGISVATLRKVYNRGVAAWKTGHRPGTTPQQWGHARVNAFIAKKKKGGLNHDTDLAHTEYEGEMTEAMAGRKRNTPVTLAGPNLKGKAVDSLSKSLTKTSEPYKKTLAKKALDPANRDIRVMKLKKEEEEHPNCGTDQCCNECEQEEVMEEVTIMEDGEKKGVKLNNIIRTSENPNKKFKVYVRDPSTKKIKVVRFGDPNMEIKRDDPNRRKNFRARHNCDNPGPKTKARYWSCKQWRGGAKVEN